VLACRRHPDPVPGDWPVGDIITVVTIIGFSGFGGLTTFAAIAPMAGAG
jgi:hypothetical protein